jgi:hypothetical protein
MTADPLAGPFPTSLMLTDYSDMPGYAILLPDLGPEGERLAREERWT